ncbi:MAG: biopolymer transporter ExbD [Oscillospiraceae bacterium]|nr:biopolymer transporter ExbD [Oscillospiraceae bacterium]
MRRGHEVLLDFTTLLDVTMLLLFFFVLFSRMDVDQAKESAAADQRAAQSVMDEAKDLKNKAESQLADAQAQKEQAEEALRQLNEADAQRAADLAALQYYGLGQNLKLRLELDNTDWMLSVRRGDSVPHMLESGSVSSAQLRSILSEMRYQKEDTVLCEFLYEGEKPGSRAAYQTVQNALKALKADYPHLYISETDISPF